MAEHAIGDRHGIIDAQTASTRATEDATDLSEVLATDALTQRPDVVLNFVVSDSLSGVGYRSVNDPTGRSHELQHYVILAKEAGTALFRVSWLEPEHGGIRFSLGDREHFLRGIGIKCRHITVNTFLQVMWLCLVCRDYEQMSSLAHYPLERTRLSGTHFEEYLYMWASLWQSIWVEDSTCASQFVELVNYLTTVSETFDPVDDEYALQIAFMPVAMLSAVMDNDEELFNRQLTEALQSHREYWSHPERSVDPAGYIAWPILALVCFARDYGMDIQIESDYLPSALCGEDWAARVR